LGWGLALLSGLALVACARMPAARWDPVVAAVEPSRGDGTSDITVTVHGAHFFSKPTQHFSHGTEIDHHCRVWLDDLELPGPAVVDAQRISVVIPAGLPAGAHAVTVENAFLRRGTLAGAFRVVPPSPLTATLTVPLQAVPLQPFTVSMAVSDEGDGTVSMLAPQPLTFTGVPQVTLLSGPTPASQDLAGHGSATFSWSYIADSEGALSVSGRAQGSAIDGTPVVSNLAQASMVCEEGVELFSDPFADGTAFSEVFGFANQVYVGTNRTGRAAIRFQADGSGGETLSFALPADTGPTPSSSTAAAPFPSIGVTGCAANTLACGPDNENGRGRYTARPQFGNTWQILSGARTAGDFSYLYMSTDTSLAVPFDWVDLGVVTKGGTRTLVAVESFGGALYFGMLSSGGARRLIAARLTTPPTSAGLDATVPGDLIDLRADKMPGVGNGGGGTGPILLDAIAGFYDRVYLMNAHGCTRSQNSAPGSAGTAPGDWADCTPSNAAYGGQTSAVTAKIADLEPGDLSAPAFASFNGSLFAARNTVAGPQLWRCSPGTKLVCDPGDWALVAGDASNPDLSRMNDPQNGPIALLAATANALWVGYDNPNGLTLYRTTAPSPLLRGDFQGRLGCTPGANGCTGFASPVLAGSTRIFSAAPLTFGSDNLLFVTVGGGTSPVRVVRFGG
jgi:hypothetical protein